MTTTKDDFAAEDWKLLMSAPAAAAVLIIGSDFHLFGLPGEFNAMAEGAMSAESAGEARGLVAEMITDMEDADDGDDDLPDTDDEEWSAEFFTQLTDAANIVDQICTVDEALGYKRWVLHVANVTAEASTEGRFLGIGGARVSDKEKTSLAEIESALQL